MVLLSLLLGIVSLNAQIQQSQSVTFETNNQSIFDPNPAVVLGDTFLLLQDNGKDASFFVEPVYIDAMIHDPNLGDTGFEVLAKFGIDFDMYARYLFNSGSADIDYPVEIKFTKPNDGNYGCSQEMWINSTYSVNSGYKMTLEEPQAEFAMGTQLDAGFFVGARACFTNICDEGVEDHGNPSFKNANKYNFHNYLVDGNYDYLRISSGDGLQLPWDLLPLIPPPPGVPNYTLPYQIDPAIENYANISGELDQPFRDFDSPDLLMGQAIVDKGTYEFVDIEFDPIQFQEYLTHIPLTFSLNVGPIHLNFAVISIPFIFRNSLFHEFKFDPKVKADLDLGQPMPWREMKGATLIQSGNSQIVENFTIGNDLGLTLPDNNPMNIVPTAKISNQFKAKMDMIFNAALAFRLMYGDLIVDGVPASGPPLIKEKFGLNEEIPLGSVTNNIMDKTFEMGGFNTIPMNPIELHPDMTPPLMVIKNITVNIPDQGGVVTISPQDVVLSAVDGQGGVIRYLSVTPSTFSCGNLGPNTVTIVIDDSRCNITTGTAIVTVLDRTKPTVVCKPATVYLNGLGMGYINQADVFQSGGDNCGILNLESVSNSTFNCSNLGANTVILTVNDGHGNTNSCSATVTVIDNIPPSIYCQPATVYLNALGLANLNPASIYLNGADNCGVVNLQAATPGVYNCSNIGDNNAVLTANDGHGNNATCSTIVTVLDKIPPTVACKSAIVNLDNNGAGSITTANVFLNGADNCGLINQESVMPATFDCSALGVNTVVLTVNDGYGNTNTCTALVTVRDLIKPTPTCPANISTTNDIGVCGASVLFTATATDNCSISSLIPVPESGSLFNIGVTQVTYTAADLSNNTATCTFTITVKDTESPVITCPANVVLENEPGKCNAVATYPNASATDNCAVQDVIKTDGIPSGFVFPVGISYIVYRATDIYGNTSTCNFSVEIRDTEAPKLVCPSDLNKPNDFGDCGRRMSNIGAPSQLSDNCGIFGVTNNSPVDFPIGETSVVWAITDIHGNTASCIQKITISDQDWPQITCPPNIKIKTDEGYCEASNVSLNAIATDNCPGVMLAYDWDLNNPFSVGYTNVEASATDIYGHRSTCIFQVIVENRPEICNGVDDDCDGITDEIQDWEEIFRAVAESGQSNHLLGSSVAINGDWALIGAPGTGKAYLLHRSDLNPSDWLFAKTFINSSNSTDDLFGSSVSLQNGIAVIGAPHDNTKGFHAGAAHIFVQSSMDTSEWLALKTIYSSDAADAANFGKSVKIKNQTLLVGATGANAAYVFGQNEGGSNNWGQIQKLSPSSAGPESEFGLSLDFNQLTAVVGAPKENTVYVFDPANNWLETQQIQAFNGETSDRFAQSISLEGNRLVIGTPGDDDKGLDAGAVYVFAKNQFGAFIQQQKIIDVATGNPGDAFGYCVSIRGDYVAVGAPMDDLRGKDAGAVHIFLREDGGWLPLIALTQNGSRNDDHFGQSLQLQPGSLIAGTPGDDISTRIDQGSAGIFEGLCSTSQREQTSAIVNRNNPLTLTPNPTTNETSIQFVLPIEQPVHIRVFDPSGRLVKNLEENGQVGKNVYNMNFAGLAAGVYFIDIQSKDLNGQKRLVVQKN